LQNRIDYALKELQIEFFLTAGRPEDVLRFFILAIHSQPIPGLIQYTTTVLI